MDELIKGLKGTRYDQANAIKKLADLSRDEAKSDILSNMEVLDGGSNVLLCVWLASNQIKRTEEMKNQVDLESLEVVLDTARLLSNLTVHTPELFVNDRSLWETQVSIDKLLKEIYDAQSNTWSKEQITSFLKLIRVETLFISNLYSNVASKGFIPTTPSPSPFVEVSNAVCALAKIAASACRRDTKVEEDNVEMFKDSLNAIEHLIDACDDALVLVFTDVCASPTEEQLKNMCLDPTILKEVFGEVCLTIRSISSNIELDMDVKSGVILAGTHISRVLSNLAGTLQKCCQLIHDESSQLHLVNQARTMIDCCINISTELTCFMVSLRGSVSYSELTLRLIHKCDSLEEKDEFKYTVSNELKFGGSSAHDTHKAHMSLGLGADCDQIYDDEEFEDAEESEEDQDQEKDMYGLGERLKLWVDTTIAPDGYLENPPVPTKLALLSHAIDSVASIDATPVLQTDFIINRGLVPKRLLILPLLICFVSLDNISKVLKTYKGGSKKLLHGIFCDLEAIRNSLSALLTDLKSFMISRAHLGPTDLDATAMIMEFIPEIYERILNLHNSTDVKVNKHWNDSLHSLRVCCLGMSMETVSMIVSLHTTCRSGSRDQIKAAAFSFAKLGLQTMTKDFLTLSYISVHLQPFVAQQILRCLGGATSTAATCAPELTANEEHECRSMMGLSIVSVIGVEPEKEFDAPPIELLVEALTLSWTLSSELPESSSEESKNEFEDVYQSILTQCSTFRNSHDFKDSEASYRILKSVVENSTLRGLITAQGPVPMTQMCILAFFDRIMNVQDPDNFKRGIDVVVSWLLQRPYVFVRLFTSLFSLSSEKCGIIQMRMAANAVGRKLCDCLKQKVEVSELARCLVNVKVPLKDGSSVSFEAYFSL